MSSNERHSGGRAGANAVVEHGVLGTGQSTQNIAGIHYHNYHGINPQQQSLTLRELLSFKEMRRRERTVDNAHDGTCKWFFNTKQHLKWIANPLQSWHHGLLWVKANAGAGKSTLMKFAVEHARRAPSEDLILPHFFNARGATLEKSIEGTLRTLIVWLIDELSPTTVQQLESTYGGNPGQEWYVPDLVRLLMDAVEGMGRRPMIFYIDALDECPEQEISKMLWVFADMVRRANSPESGQRIRVCLASRPYPAIVFTNAIFLDLGAEEQHHSDIKKYVYDRLAIGNSETALSIRRDVCKKAQGIFMWVVLVVDLLNADYQTGEIQKLQERLRGIPDGLQKLFTYTLERYPPDDRQTMLVCFRWLLLADTGFRCDWTSHLWWAVQLGLGRPDGEIFQDYRLLDEAAMERQILSKTKGLIDFDYGRPKFVHESVREFVLHESELLGGESHSEFEAASHENIRDCYWAEVLACRQLVLQMANDMGESSCVEHNKLNNDLYERPLAREAAEGAMRHAEAAQRLGRDQRAFLDDFSQTGPWIVFGFYRGSDQCLYSLMSLLLFSECETLIRQTQLQSARQARLAGHAPGFIDVQNGRLCPALEATLRSSLFGRHELSPALIKMYLDLEDRPPELQSMMERLATDLKTQPFEAEPYGLPLMDLADANESLAAFFLLSLTPLASLEPHLPLLKAAFSDQFSKEPSPFERTLSLIIEHQLPTDAIDCMSPQLLAWVTDRGEDYSDEPDRQRFFATMEQTLRSCGVQMPEEWGHLSMTEMTGN